MAGFVRDILTTLSYEPHATEPLGVDGEALTRLDQRLAGFTQGSAQARTAISIRPSDCSVWDGNPRDVPGLSAESCRSLIESIAQEDGNRIPVLVRRNPPGADYPYQLLVGSRRRFSVDWLNHNGRPEIRLTALIVDLTDEEAFRLADIENREREDITELDRARSYQNAVDRFYGGVQSRMAEALNLSNSQLSRLLALAQMPDEVVNAFATRDELRVPARGGAGSRRRATAACGPGRAHDSCGNGPCEAKGSDQGQRPPAGQRNASGPGRDAFRPYPNRARRAGGRSSRDRGYGYRRSPGHLAYSVDR